MKIRVLKNIETIGLWKRNPWGFAVVKVSDETRVEAVATGSRIVLVRISSNADRAFRQLEKISEEFDANPKGMRPRVVVVKGDIADDPRSRGFMSRAAVIVEV